MKRQEKAERARLAEEQRKKTAWEAQRDKEAAEDVALRAQPWFPPLERLLDGQRIELRRDIERWVGENYMADNTPDYYCS